MFINLVNHNVLRRFSLETFCSVYFLYKYLYKSLMKCFFLSKKKSIFIFVNYYTITLKHSSNFEIEIETNYIQIYLLTNCTLYIY